MKDGLVNLFDYEIRARESMPRILWDRVYYGTGDELSTKRIRPAFESILLRPRALRPRDGTPDTSTTVLGSRIALPVMPSAAGSKYYLVRDGDVQIARAAAAADTVSVIPHITTYHDSVESYRRAAPDGIFWFQLSVLEDRGVTREVIERAEAGGCKAIILTVDSPQNTDSRGKFQPAKSAADVREEAYYAEHFPGAPKAGPEFGRRDSSITWSIIDWLRSVTHLPIIVKGILSAQDARIAAETGVDGILVSTHAGRRFDGPITSIEALPPVVEAVNGRCEVYVDGGIRSGVDVLKALAIGARACLIGKPLFYGLAVDGEAGVRDIFDIFKRELELAMTLCGASSIAEIDPTLVSLPERVLA